MKRAIILVLDSFGVGATQDAIKFGDQGANTLGHIAEHCFYGKCDDGERQGHLNIPNLVRLGLGLSARESSGQFPKGIEDTNEIIGTYGYATELSTGKDTSSGHWEIAGVPVLFNWGYFKDKQNSFPKTLLDKIVTRADLPGYLGNCHASGTEILNVFGKQHMETGKPIFYTSADSVFQIACHEQTFGLENLFRLCSIVREELDNFNIARVIARPFIGEEVGKFERTGNRKDFSLEPPSKTVLSKLVDEKGGDVVSIGKISDIYAGCGITKEVKAAGIKNLFDETLKEVKTAKNNTIIFTNFVDFDSHFGHRRDVIGYAKAIEYFDKRIPELLDILENDDILILTSDHGCDPTWPGSDHTREHIPILAYGKNIPSKSIGKRDTFSDIGQTISCFFDTSAMAYGKSFI